MGMGSVASKILGRPGRERTRLQIGNTRIHVAYVPVSVSCHLPPSRGNFLRESFVALSAFLEGIE